MHSSTERQLSKVGPGASWLLPTATKACVLVSIAGSTYHKPESFALQAGIQPRALLPEQPSRFGIAAVRRSLTGPVTPIGTCLQWHHGLDFDMCWGAGERYSCNVFLAGAGHVMLICTHAMQHAGQPPSCKKKPSTLPAQQIQ